MTSPACTKITNAGLNNSLPLILLQSAITTTAPAKTTPTPTTNDKLWAAKSSSPSPRANSTLDLGNRSSTANSTAEGRNGCWSRLSANERVRNADQATQR